MALTTWPNYKAAAYQAEQVNKHMWVCKGIGTNELYVLEVDPVTGGLPISFAGTQDFGPAAQGLRVAALVGNASGIADFGSGVATAQTLRVVLSSSSPVTLAYDTDWGVVGATTLRGAAQIGNATGAASFGAGNSSAQTLRTVIATDQSAIPSSQSGTWSVGVTNFPATVATGSGTGGASTLRVITDTRSEAAATPLSVRQSNGTSFADYGAGTTGTTTLRVSANITRDGTALSYNAGAADANTLRVALATGGSSIAYLSGAYVTSTRTDFSSVTLSLSTWTQLVASTSAIINQLTAFMSSGVTLELGLGAAASETRTLLVPPGGFDAVVPLNIPAGSRVSVRAVDAVPSSGFLTVNYIA